MRGAPSGAVAGERRPRAHLCFAGATHRFRVRHDRIVSFVPYEDGVSITRDRANARPELFRSGDGRFFYNLPRQRTERRGAAWPT